MHPFINRHIKTAKPFDIPAIVDLLNIAYRGETSRQGWTTEGLNYSSITPEEISASVRNIFSKLDVKAK